MINRRQMILSSATAAIGLGLRPALAGPHEFAQRDYDRAMVIDALGTLGEFNPDAAPDAMLSAQALADMRASGITALNFTVNEVGNGPDKFFKAVASIAGVEAEIVAHPDLLMIIRNGADLKTAKSTHRFGIIMGCQDTTMLEGDLSRLSVFRDLGVRIVQPTYNVRNLLGDGSAEPADGGLSRMGFDFISQMNQLHMLIDLSHAGQRTIAQGIAASKTPVAISHTGCRDLVDLPRNTRDSDLRALAAKGGVAGIYFMPFLRASGQPHAADLIAHIEHAVNVCGEDHVGLGTDGLVSGFPMSDAFKAFHRKDVEERRKAGLAAPGESVDVYTLVPEYNDSRRFKHLADDLIRRGWSSTRIEKILGANFARLFTEVWGSGGTGF